MLEATEIGKTFNTAGKCIPTIHYMVDISRQTEEAAKLVRRGNYFCINRGRQYGKTTTLAELKKKLEKEGYAVFSLSFEGLGNGTYSSLNTLSQYFLRLMYTMAKTKRIHNITEEAEKILLSQIDASHDSIDTLDFKLLINELTSKCKIVIIIDEVDQAGNHLEFVKFLGLLRDMYLNRDEVSTFQSVILAGVYDIKNLKLKMRSEDLHQYNSPWNIAVPFDIDMSLPADGIAQMLAEYKQDHRLDFDEKSVGQMIRDYTAGYPFLVSRICQIIDSQDYGWDKEGVLKAVHDLLLERNTLFDDMIKKLDEYPELKDTLKNVLYSGTRYPYNPDEKYMQIATMFNFASNINGTFVISCRLIETRLYNYFLAEGKQSSIYKNGELDKNQFIHDGHIDMRHLIEQFTVHFNEIYRPGHDDHFVEENGRQIFLTYLRPIINGVGNYYCEAQTRDLTRTDVVVDYMGHQYIVELKIWRGNAYNERGEKQLSEYLDFYHLQTGYMVSFCFNKNKQTGIKEVMVGERKLWEAVV